VTEAIGITEEMPDGSAFSNVSEVHHIWKFYNYLSKVSRNCPTVACYGGGGSGKSQGIIQEYVDRFMNEDDIRILVVRKTGPALTDTTFQMFCDELDTQGYIEGVDYKLNRSTLTMWHGPNIIMFRSMDKQEKKKSLNVNYIYIEEATELTYQDYNQLTFRVRRPNKKMNQIHLSWNPTDAYHWTKTLIIDKGIKEGEWKPGQRLKIMYQHSTFLDNPFLPEDYRERLIDLQGQDKELYSIYALGEYATITNVIYTNWVIDNPCPSYEPECYGLDFGFNAPSALVSIAREPNGLKNKFYVSELFYKNKHTNADLITALKTIIPLQWRYKIIYADSAEPARIEEINRAGFHCEPAEKDVNKGIDTVKTCELHYRPNDVNLHGESRMYKWKVDKYERVLDEPIGMNDHAMGAMRYAIYNFWLNGGGAKVSIDHALPASSMKKMKIPVWGSRDGGIPKM
jgi:phage terminase large subunit